MIEFKFAFLPNQFMVGIAWHHNDEFTRLTHHWFFNVWLGPFSFMWCKPRPYQEWIGPFTDGPLSDVTPKPKLYFESLVSDIRKSTEQLGTVPIKPEHEPK